MVMIPEAVIPAKTSLKMKDGVRPSSVQMSLLRYNIRQAAEEDPALLRHVLVWQAAMDAHGHGGCYDMARPELAARMPS